MDSPSLSDAVSAALRLKCPNCAQTKLYKRYLKQVDACPNCQVKWSEIRADDGPAWLTILVVGHVMASVAVWAAVISDLPTWQIVAYVALGCLVLTLALLPFAKAIFIAFIWKTKAGSAKTSENTE